MPLAGRLIAFIHQSADLYGSDRILLSLAEKVQAAGGRSVVLLPGYGPLTDALASRKIEYHVVPVIKIARSSASLKGVMKLGREILTATNLYDNIFQGRTVDLVHSNTLAAFGGALWSRRRKIPHLWHVHEIIERPKYAAVLFPWMLRTSADWVVCNSRATMDWLLGAQPTLQSRTSVISNGIPLPRAPSSQETELLRQKYLNGMRLAVGLVGRINRMKGHALLLSAVENLVSRGCSDFSVVFVGSPPPGQEYFQHELTARIERSPVRDRVILQKYTEDLSSVYAALDVICIPSTEPESFGLVAVEAMSMGRPVIASRFGGLTELVSNGVTGYLFTPRSAEALADSLEVILESDEIRLNMGKAAAPIFKSKFTVDRMILSFIAQYRALFLNEDRESIGKNNEN
jgi:glycosyltransferase involved in cell wall biosynthesis